MSITTINPANGEVLETYPLMDAAEISDAIEPTKRAFQEWKRANFAERSKVLAKAEHADEYLGPDFVKTESKKNYVTFQPLELILAVMPWTFSLWQVFRFAAPALMAIALRLSVRNFRFPLPATKNGMRDSTATKYRVKATNPGSIS